MKLWTFAFKHVATQWNNTPKAELNWLTPNECFAGTGKLTKKKKHHFKNHHPFGCPVYVLTEAIQDNKKPPRWDPRTRVGIYLGRSTSHASDVAWILNPITDHISPQYHVIFDDNFSTTKCTSDAGELTIWKGLYKRAKPSNIKFDLPQKDTFSYPEEFPNHLVNLDAASVTTVNSFEVPDPEELASLPPELQASSSKSKPKSTNKKGLTPKDHAHDLSNSTQTSTDKSVSSELAPQAAPVRRKSAHTTSSEGVPSNSTRGTKTSEGGILKNNSKSKSKGTGPDKLTRHEKRKIVRGLLDPSIKTSHISGKRRSKRLRKASKKS